MSIKQTRIGRLRAGAQFRMLRSMVFRVTIVAAMPAALVAQEAGMIGNAGAALTVGHVRMGESTSSLAVAGEAGVNGVGEDGLMLGAESASGAEGDNGLPGEVALLAPAEIGACCTGSGCVSNLPQMICELLYGVGNWHPGEVCSDDGGEFDCPVSNLAACCGSGGCEMRTEEVCVDLYGAGAWHVGETCATYTCPIPMGACCVEDNGGCFTLDEESCDELEDPAVWYPGEQCVEDGGDFECPMNTAACCTDEGCLDLGEADCDALVGQGRWFKNNSCSDATFSCPAPSTDSLFWQFPNSGTPSGSLFISDASWPFFSYERFWDLNGDICGVRWVGWMANTQAVSPTSCQVDGFILRFYEIGDDLRPGAEVAVEYVSMEDSNLQLALRPDWGWGLNSPPGMRQVYEFQYEMDSCLALRDGYVSITGLGQYPDCVLWIAGSYEGYNASSSAGDYVHCGQPGVDSSIVCGRYWNGRDLAIELRGPEVAGACCDDVAGTCSVVMPSECAGGRFEAGLTCQELDPPCGGMAGACCSEEDPCYLSYEADCEEAYAGNGTTCDPVDCNSNGTADACDIASGFSSDCDGSGIPDECEIATNASTDYDGNGIPDECDPDGNANGIPDACDIDCAVGACDTHPFGCGGSSDCQGDGIPDEAQLGTLGSAIIRNNGLPEPRALETDGASQEGGEWEHAIVLDDFVVPAGGTEINGITFHTETSEDFEWSGRVRVRIHANRAFWSPEGARWQTDGDPNATLVDIWAPDDGGTVTRVANGPGTTFDRYLWTISDIAIPLEEGPYFISFAPEADGEDGVSLPCFSNVETLDWDAGSIYRSEAWRRIGLTAPFGVLETPEFGGVDIAFVLTTDRYGSDENNNGVPDVCDPNGDFDADGDVDLVDYALFSDCLTGPFGVATSECELQDIDGDDDVDLDDFGLFTTVFTGGMK